MKQTPDNCNIVRRSFFLIAIKYAPVILAITCAAKIFILSNNDSPKSAEELLVNWINLALNAFFLIVFYSAGRYFHFCWKHKSLCRIAGWGYAYYAVFLLSGAPHDAVLPLTTFYLLLVLFLTPFYREL